MNNFWKNKKVLVTGGGGFIGSNAVKELMQRGSLVTITVSSESSTGKIKKIFGDLFKEINIQKVDLLSLNDCVKSTKSIDVVLNFAALDGSSKFKKEYSEKIYKVNTTIVKNILEASRLNNVDRVLLMSSTDVYPENIGESISEEDADMNIKGGYVGSKVFSENLARKYYEKYSLKIAIARPGNVYGPGDTISPERARVVPTFIKKAINDENIEISISTKISFLYVSDLINALLDITEKYSVCDPVNLAGNEKVSLEDLARIILKITKSKGIVVIDKKRIRIREKTIDTTKAKKIIGFIEKKSLEKGLSSLIDVLAK